MAVAVGAISQGTLIPSWYNFLDHIVQQKTYWAVIGKSAASLMVLTPAILLGQRMHEVEDGWLRGTRSWAETLAENWERTKQTAPIWIGWGTAWPLYHCLCFALVPLERRSLATGVAGVFWSVVLAYLLDRIGGSEQGQKKGLEVDKEAQVLGAPTRSDIGQILAPCASPAQHGEIFVVPADHVFVTEARSTQDIPGASLWPQPTSLDVNGGLEAQRDAILKSIQEGSVPPLIKQFLLANAGTLGGPTGLPPEWLNPSEDLQSSDTLQNDEADEEVFDSNAPGSFGALAAALQRRTMIE